MSSLILLILLALLASSFLVAFSGPLVHNARLGGAAGGISHASLLGLGLAGLFGMPGLPMTLLFAIFFALFLAWQQTRHRDSVDSMISVLWSVGMAGGIIFFYLTPGYQQDLHNFLFGNVLLMQWGALLALSIVVILWFLFVLFRYRHLEMLLSDEIHFRLKGHSVMLLRSQFYILLFCSIVLLAYSLGIVLLVALLSIPSLTVAPLQKSFFGQMISVFFLSLLSLVSGFFLSWHFDLPTSATAVLLLFFFFLLSRVYLRLKQRT